MTEQEKYKKKLNKIFKNIASDKLTVVEPLIDNASFMVVELKKLSEYIAVNGCTEEYQNGQNQFGKKKSSEVEVYNAMVKNYATIIKQIIELLPEKTTETDELMEFFKQ